MKRKLVFISILLFLGSCKKEDFNRPEIQIIGELLVINTLNSPYNDAGAIAFDKEDGDISSSISVTNPVDRDYATLYHVRYNVSDKAGNIADEVLRQVVVQNSAEVQFAGTYAVQITTLGQPPYSYNERIDPSKTLNWRIDFSKFGDYPNASDKISADIVGNDITIFNQTITSGSNPVQRTISGNGTISINQSTKKPEITIMVTETVNSVSTDYTYYYAML